MCTTKNYFLFVLHLIRFKCCIHCVEASWEWKELARTIKINIQTDLRQFDFVSNKTDTNLAPLIEKRVAAIWPLFENTRPFWPHFLMKYEQAFSVVSKYRRHEEHKRTVFSFHFHRKNLFGGYIECNLSKLIFLNLVSTSEFSAHCLHDRVHSFVLTFTQHSLSHS